MSFKSPTAKLLVVVGVPIPQPRRIFDSRHMRNVSNHGKVQRWKEIIKLAWLWQQPRSIPFGGPLQLDLLFLMPRPSERACRGKRPVVEGRPDGPLWHTTKPDKDNLEKSFKDALKGLAWTDDALVCDGRIAKMHHEIGGRPGVIAVIRDVPRRTGSVAICPCGSNDNVRVRSSGRGTDFDMAALCEPCWISCIHEMQE